MRSKLSSLWPELIICGEAENGPDALKLIEKNRPDVAFLDIKMPGMSGIEVARRMTSCCNVVFITAYDQYAIEAFENEAIDYLLKPIKKERLATALHKVMEKRSTKTYPEKPI